MVLLNTAMLHQVRCIRKGAGTEAQQRITHIGGGSASRAWLMPIQSAISGMEQGLWCFCVLQEGRVLPVVVATAPRGEKYLKTVNDGEQPDHLLALTECSSEHHGSPADECSEIPR
jgi:hypothetical protein